MWIQGDVQSIPQSYSRNHVIQSGFRKWTWYFVEKKWFIFVCFVYFVVCQSKKFTTSVVKLR